MLGISKMYLAHLRTFLRAKNVLYLDLCESFLQSLDLVNIFFQLGFSDIIVAMYLIDYDLRFTVHMSFLSLHLARQLKSSDNCLVSREYVNSIPSGLVKSKPAPLPSLLDAPSTNNNQFPNLSLRVW